MKPSIAQSRLDVLCGSMFSGKCLKTGTKVLLHNLQSKSVEELVDGDRLLGDDFQPRVVSNLHVGNGRLFTVTPTIDTTANPYTVSENHILSLMLKERYCRVFIDESTKTIRVKYIQNHKFTVMHFTWSTENRNQTFEKVRKFITNLTQCNHKGDIIDINIQKYLEQSTVWKELYCGYRILKSWNEKLETEMYSIAVTEDSTPGEYIGFTVDGNHRFLLADFTVTHNSSALIRKLNQFAELGIAVLYINHGLDDRSSQTVYSTHSPLLQNRQLGLTTIKVTDLKDLQLSEILKYDVIGIDEAQFFDQYLVQFVRCLVEQYDKYVIVVGLDGNFRREKFGHILDLIPLADKVSKLHAYCKPCIDQKKVKTALFTYYKGSESTNDVIIGGSDVYQPVCRECYLKLNS